MSQQIAGAYKLEKYGYTYKADGRFEDISDFYSGEIHYGDNGRMSVVLRFAEKPEEFADVVAYSGTYEVDGPKIHHVVTASVRPDYEGQKLDRTFTLKDGVLELTFEDTPEFVKAARWRKL